MEISGDDIAEVVLREFERWPKKAKPVERSEKVKEWVPLSGIVAHGRNTGSLTCLAAATGMKCLPQNKISQAQGVTLHDWHAEILAIRTFNRFLLEECNALASYQKESSEFVKFRNQHEITTSNFQPFALKDGIDLHMYCSEAPCGDASMELTMAAQEDSTPWDLPELSVSPANNLSESLLSNSNSDQQQSLHGRGYFSALGAVRRKPSRPDAPPTLSKSCSDKLALKQSTSLLSSVASLLISPGNCYLSSLVLPSSQYSSTACDRAFSSSGRLSSLQGKGKHWEGGYAFKPFNLLTTDREFVYSRRQVLQSGEKLAPSNISTSWTPDWSETLIGGTLQGKKQFSLKGASRVCKRRTWKLALEVACVMSMPVIEECISVASYGEMKKGIMLKGRRIVKEDVREKALEGWVRNEGGEDWVMDGVES